MKVSNSNIIDKNLFVCRRGVSSFCISYKTNQKMLHLARTRTNCLMMKLWVDDKLLHDNVGLPQLVVVAVHPTFLSLYYHLPVSNPIPLPRSLTIKERQNFFWQSPFRPRTGNKITQATILQYVWDYFKSPGMTL